MRCQLQHITGDRYRCKVCGHVLLTRTPEQTHTVCPGHPVGPTLAAKAIHYAQAVAGHIVGGCQTRTDEEVSDLLKICEACEHFLRDTGSCGICGCRCNRNASAWTNKLRMQTQHCPKGKWK